MSGAGRTVAAGESALGVAFEKYTPLVCRDSDLGALREDTVFAREGTGAQRRARDRRSARDGGVGSEGDQVDEDQPGGEASEHAGSDSDGI